MRKENDMGEKRKMSKISKACFICCPVTAIASVIFFECALLPAAIGLMILGFLFEYRRIEKERA